MFREEHSATWDFLPKMQQADRRYLTLMAVTTFGFSGISRLDSIIECLRTNKRAMIQHIIPRGTSSRRLPTTSHPSASEGNSLGGQYE